MNSETVLKTSWDWEEWRQSREARRAAAKRVGLAVVRREASYSRLRRTFKDLRGSNDGPADTPSRQTEV